MAPKPAPILTFAPKIDPEAPAWLRQHLTLIYQKLNNHAQAFSIQAQKAPGSTTTSKTIIEAGTVTSGGGTTTASIGIVNNQGGATAYSTTSGDYGAIIVLSDSLPISVTLSEQTPPWFCWIYNLGAGIATLTPASGTINGGASYTLLQNFTAVIAFDGTNWWAGTSPIVPVNTPAVASEWLNSYNAATGAFTIAQPAFTDITGIAQVSQGGTGMATPTLVAGTNVTITGSWPGQTINSSTAGFSGTITTAKLTVGGANGSVTFLAGVLVSQVSAT